MALEREDIGHVRPLHDFVLVKTEEVGVSKGGIYMPSSSRDPITEGIVLRVGPGRWNDYVHERVPVQVKPGDRIRFRAWTGAELDGARFRAEHILIREGDVMAVVGEGD